MWTAEIINLRLSYLHLNLYFRSSHHLHCFIPFTGYDDFNNWPAPHVWVFTAQLVEHGSANADATSLNFFRVNLQMLKLQLPLRQSFKFIIVIRNRNHNHNHSKPESPYRIKCPVWVHTIGFRVIAVNFNTSHWSNIFSTVREKVHSTKIVPKISRRFSYN